MIGNPLALLGVLAIAVPVIIHLIGRHQARTLRFPSLRFVEAPRVRPTSRRRITDIPLLLVRASIVALIALALARPLFLDHSAQGSAARTHRVLVIDTTMSVPPDSIGAVAARLAADAATSTLVRTDRPHRELEGASDWLALRGGRGEIVVISDFQEGTLDSLDVAAIRPEVGVSLVPMSPRIIAGFISDSLSIQVIATAEERARALIAARVAGVRVVDSAAIAIIIGGPISAVGPARNPRTIARLAADSLLRTVAASARVVTPIPPGVRPLVANGRGETVVGVAGERPFHVWVADAGGSLLTAAVMSALRRAQTAAFDPREATTSFVEPARLKAWERPSIELPAPSDERSDGRWLWLTALILVGIEGLMRRSKRAVTALPLPSDIERAA